MTTIDYTHHATLGIEHPQWGTSGLYGAISIPDSVAGLADPDVVVGAVREQLVGYLAFRGVEVPEVVIDRALGFIAQDHVHYKPPGFDDDERGFDLHDRSVHGYLALAAKATGNKPASGMYWDVPKSAR